MILECWCIVRWHHSYDCWAYIHRHLHQERKMYLKVCTDHNTVFIVFFRQTLDRAAGENLMFILLAHQQRQNYPSAATSPQKQRSRRPSWHWEMGKRDTSRETATDMLHSLFSKIWEKEEVPAQWKEGIVIMLPNKRDLRDCNNYRGIMLLSRQSAQQSSIGEDERGSRSQALRSAGWLRRNRSCTDKIASLRIIVEQSLEWNSPLYINFIDYEKAFDSVDRETLWKLLRHYGFPEKIIALIRCTYQDMSCKIAHAGQLSESFEVKTGVRQGCLLSPFLFLLVIDWIMKTTTTGRNNWIQWTPWTQLDDLNSADDLALLSHNHWQMQDKTTCLETISAGTGLKISKKKTELMKINTTANTPVTVDGEPIREMHSFIYLGSAVDRRGARTEMSQPGLAWPEQLLSCSRTSGRPRRSGQEPNFASSTPMWSQSCSTDAKLGGRQRQCNRKSKHSLTSFCGASATSDGQRWSQMSCESERDRNQ